MAKSPSMCRPRLPDPFAVMSPAMTTGKYEGLGWLFNCSLPFIIARKETARPRTCPAENVLGRLRRFA
jgi:hypothetical protein